MHKIALYFMFIHRENALKSHQYISYCSIQRDHFKKTILIQNLIKIFTKTHQIAHFFKIFSQGSMPPSTALPVLTLGVPRQS